MIWIQNNDFKEAGMADRCPGPMGLSYFQPNWIDDDTLNRTRSHCPGPTGKPPKEKGFRVTLKFGSQKWNKILFDDAANMIETYVRAEHAACNKLVKEINKDYWITSFWSEVLGGAKPPAYADWIRPVSTLQSARSANRGSNYSAARMQLLKAVEHYNAVHRKWIGYRDRLDKGGNAAITTMEITIVVLSTAASAGYGAQVAGQSTRLLGGAWTIPARGALLKGASMAGGLAGGTTAAKQVGLVAQGVEKKIDVAQIALDTIVAFGTSLVGGKLSEKFLQLMTPRVAAAITFDKTIVEAAKRAGVLLPASYSLPQQLLSEFLGGAGTNMVAEAVKTAATKAKGKNMTMLELMTLIAQEISKETLATALKAYFARKAR